MRVGRNDPCPCGSGKKYKKCCLEKDQQAARLPPPAPAVPQPTVAPPVEQSQDEPEAWEAETDWDEDEEPAEETEEPTGVKYPRPDEQLPELPPEQNKIIDDWWDKASPFYRENDADTLLKMVEAALAEHPDLFVHLGLHEELIFALGEELAHRGRMPD